MIYSDEEIEGFRRLDYEHAGQSQISWDCHADRLKRAADILLKAFHDKQAELRSHPGPITTAEGANGWMESFDSSLDYVYYMLIGYSIEDRIKGIIMVNHPEYLKDGLPEINQHNTRELLKRNDITEFVEYNDVLQELEYYVTWKGRYPIPKNYEQHEVVHDPIDSIRLNELYNKLYKRSILERRLDIIKKKFEITYKNFMAIQNEIVSFIAVPGITMSKIRETYPQYPKEIIIHVLEDHLEDLQDESKRNALKYTLERWKLNGDDEELYNPPSSAFGAE